MIASYKKYKHILITLLALASAIGIYAFYNTQQNITITPSYVFAETQHIINTLELYAQASDINTKSVQTTIYHKRHPRHVMQKTREVLLRVDRFKINLGLRGVSYPIFPVRKVQPRNVLQLVELTSMEINELQQHYLVRPKRKSPYITPGKTPSNVYGNLHLASQYLDLLGAEPLTPSDVFQMAETAIQDLYKICQSVPTDCPQELSQFQEGKIPADVYKQLLAAINKLSIINAKLKQPVEGGILETPQKTNDIVPADVLELYNGILADIGAIKDSLRVKAPSILNVRQEEITPSHVHQQATLLNSILSHLIIAMESSRYR